MWWRKVGHKTNPRFHYVVQMGCPTVPWHIASALEDFGKAGTDKLVVLAAFTKTDEGELVPALEPRQVDTEERALREARLIASHYAGGVEPRCRSSARGVWSADDPVSGR